MPGLLNLMSKIERLPTEKVAEDSLNQIAPDLVEAQKDQLAKGQSATGDKIHWQADSHYPYTRPYAKRKTAFGGQTQVVDLKGETGEYYNQIQAKAEAGKVIIRSMDEKAQYLEKNYNKDEIDGLNSEHRAVIIREKLRPAFILNIRQFLRV